MNDTVSLTELGMVRIFHERMGGGTPAPATALMCLLEEMDEFEDSTIERMVENADGYSSIIEPDEEHILKELCDVLYTAYGYALSLGWDIQEAFRRVHTSNMTKKPTTEGKIQKGPDYVAPELGDLV